MPTAVMMALFTMIWIICFIFLCSKLKRGHTKYPLNLVSSASLTLVDGL